MQSVNFTDQSAKSVPYNTVPYFFTDGYSEVIPIRSVFPHIYNNITIGIGFPVCIYLTEFISFF